MKKILSLLRRCVEDYDMIQAGDRIAVGVSVISVERSRI